MYTTTNQAHFWVNNLQRQLRCLLTICLFAIVLKFSVATASDCTRSEKILSPLLVEPEEPKVFTIVDCLGQKEAARAVEEEHKVIKELILELKYDHNRMVNEDDKVSVWSVIKNLETESKNYGDFYIGNSYDDNLQFNSTKPGSLGEYIVRGKNEGKLKDAAIKTCFEEFIEGLKTKTQKILAIKGKGTVLKVYNDSHNIANEIQDHFKEEAIKMLNIMNNDDNKYAAKLKDYKTVVATIHAQNKMGKLRPQWKKMDGSDWYYFAEKELNRIELATLKNDAEKNVTDAVNAKNWEVAESNHPVWSNAEPKQIKHSDNVAWKFAAHDYEALPQFKASQDYQINMDFCRKNLQDLTLIAENISAIGIESWSQESLKELCEEKGKQSVSVDETNGKYKVNGLAFLKEKHGEDETYFGARDQIKKTNRIIIKLGKYNFDCNRMLDIFGWTDCAPTMLDHILGTRAILKRFVDGVVLYISRFNCSKCDNKDTSVHREEADIDMNCCGSVMQRWTAEWNITIACGNKSFKLPAKNAPKTIKPALSYNILENKFTVQYTDDKAIFQVSKTIIHDSFVDKAVRDTHLQTEGTSKIERIAFSLRMKQIKKRQHPIYGIIRNAGSTGTDIAIRAIPRIITETKARIAASRLRTMSLKTNDTPDRERVRYMSQYVGRRESYAASAAMEKLRGLVTDCVEPSKQEAARVKALSLFRKDSTAQRAQDSKAPTLMRQVTVGMQTFSMQCYMCENKKEFTSEKCCSCSQQAKRNIIPEFGSTLAYLLIKFQNMNLILSNKATVLTQEKLEQKIAEVYQTETEGRFTQKVLPFSEIPKNISKEIIDEMAYVLKDEKYLTTYREQSDCAECGGNGRILITHWFAKDEDIKCTACNGNGKITHNVGTTVFNPNLTPMTWEEAEEFKRQRDAQMNLSK